MSGRFLILKYNGRLKNRNEEWIIKCETHGTSINSTGKNKFDTVSCVSTFHSQFSRD